MKRRAEIRVCGCSGGGRKLGQATLKAADYLKSAEVFIVQLKMKKKTYLSSNISRASSG